MNILITGASGFIGKNLLQSLSGKSDLNVYGVCRNLFENNFASNIKLIEADLADTNWLKKLPTEIDVVIYLAQSSRYREFPDGAADMLRINEQGVFEMLEWSRINQVKKFVFASTGNVYKPAQKLLNESDETLATSFYAASKINAENLIRQYSKFFETIVLRIFSIYGAGQQNMMFPSIIEKIKTNQTITLAGGIGIKLTPLYISDAVEMLNRIIANKIENGTYNMAGIETVTLAEIVQLMESFLQTKAVVQHTTDSYGSLTASGKKLFNAVNFEPQILIDEGIEKVCQG